jgi:phenylalanyl-tRNA synthetase beta chain
LRIDGLNNVVIPGRLNISLQSRQELLSRKWRKITSEYLSGKGFQEIVTNSITNSKYYPGNDKLVKMINSLSSELDIMRPSMLESGLEVIAYNANRKQQDLALYEAGNIYELSGGHNYKQQSRLAIWLSGHAQEQGWQQSAVKSDLYYLRGIVESMFTRCGIKFQATVQDNTIVWQRGKELLGRAFSVSQQQLKNFDIRQAVYYADLDLEILASTGEQNKIRYTELPRFPAVTRDLALVLDQHIAYEKVVQTTQTQKIATLRDFNLFDVFEGEKIGAGKKSLALSFTFQLYDRTLTDEEVEAMMQQLMKAYQKELGAVVRS